MRRLMALACISVWGLAAQALPEGKGRAQVQRICAQCHGLDVVTGMRANKDQWAAVVDDMVGRGANGTSDDFELVVQYLATNFGSAGKGKVEINKAPASELVSALGISLADASAIVTYRTDHGAFKEWAELSKVSGIDLKKLESQKDKVSFSAPAADPK